MHSARFRALWWLTMSPEQYIAIRDRVVDYLSEQGLVASLIWDKNGACILFGSRGDYDRFMALPTPSPESFGL